MENRRLAVLGVGMMGGAILNGILSRGFCAGANVTVYDVDSIKTKKFAGSFSVRVADSAPDAVKDADVVLLAVKPQYIDSLMTEIAAALPKDALIISIAAGVRLARLNEKLGAANLVRVMPNTPSQIGKGVSGWIAAAAVNAADKDYVRTLLEQIGSAVEVQSEDQLDQIGAISGSGPAFVYLFIEAMIDASVHLGMPRTAATELVIQTVIGSAEYLKLRGEHPAVLRNEVTSPGGTTAEGLYFMEKENIRTAVARCIWGCYDRTQQINRSGTRRETGPEGN